MSIATDVQNAMTAYIATKREHVERNGGPTDLGPQLVITIDGKMHLAAIPDRDYVGAAVGLIQEETGGLAERIIFCADAYIRKYAKDDPEGEALVARFDTLRGQIGEDFRAGDMTVVEALDVTGIDRDGSMCMIVAEYKYDDRGRVKFAQPVIVEASEHESIEGAVPDALRKAMKR